MLLAYNYNRTTKLYKRKTKEYHLESEQEEKRFDRVKSSINKIPKEQIVSFGAITSYFKKLFHIIKLSMNIPTYLQQYNQQSSYQFHSNKKKSQTNIIVKKFKID